MLTAHYSSAGPLNHRVFKKVSVSFMLTLSLTIMGCGSDGDSAVGSKAQSAFLDKVGCEQYRDRLVDLRLSADALGRDPETLPPGDLAQLRAGLVSTLGDDFMKSCETHTPKAELDCALNAKDAAALAACTSIKLNGGAS